LLAPAPDGVAVPEDEVGEEAGVFDSGFGAVCDGIEGAF
jgi:hypothetical protein